jgi:glutaredoxin
VEHSRSEGELGVTESRVCLLAKPGCHLCDDARAIITEVCTELGERFDEIDITSDPELMAAYAEQVPVTFVDGKQHDFWWVDADRLHAALIR